MVGQAEKSSEKRVDHPLSETGRQITTSENVLLISHVTQLRADIRDQCFFHLCQHISLLIYSLTTLPPLISMNAENTVARIISCSVEITIMFTKNLI